LNIRKLCVGVAVCTATLFGPATAAFADNCYNASRPSGGLSSNPGDFSAPVFKGHWLWLPSVGVPQPAWGFEVPANYQNSLAYQDANYGYTGNYVNQSDYNYYFRQGFRRGYDDGYYNRSQYGSSSNGSQSILSSLLSSILGLTSLR